GSLLPFRRRAPVEVPPHPPPSAPGVALPRACSKTPGLFAAAVFRSRPLRDPARGLVRPSLRPTLLRRGPRVRRRLGVFSLLERHRRHAPALGLGHPRHRRTREPQVVPSHVRRPLSARAESYHPLSFIMWGTPKALIAFRNWMESGARTSFAKPSALLTADGKFR
ncbi:MAG: hypothetical protein BJ554DRAFT_2238, partial [Olpidium bornovanus]